MLLSEEARKRLIIALASRIAGEELSGTIDTHSEEIAQIFEEIDQIQVESYTGHIEAASNKTYILDFKAAFAGTIQSLRIGTVSGTCTVAVRINGIPVTGISAIAVSSSPATALATALNSFVEGQQIILVVTANSSATDMAFTLKYTR